MKGFKLAVLGSIFLGLGLLVVNLGFAKEVRKDLAPVEAASPDLLVHSAVINPTPVLGEDIGKVVIAVVNRGNADAAASELRLNCMAEGCVQPMDCNNISQALNAVIPIKSLKVQEMTTVEWVPPMPVKWVQGEFTIVTVVDYTNDISESDEANNIRKESISMTSLKPISTAPPAQAVAPQVTAPVAPEAPVPVVPAPVSKPTKASTKK